MPGRYIATFEYTEFVNGEERTFVHESIVVADDENEAYAEALEHFQSLARASGVGWKRELERCTIVRAPRGATPQGGRRVDAERTEGE